MARDKAVAYLRVSGAGQVQGDGFARQRAAIERFAGVARLELVEEFRDEGISGTRELQNRPGLARVLDRVESNGVKVVIVERADRLARDLLVSEVILAQFTQFADANSGLDKERENTEVTRMSPSRRQQSVVFFWCQVGAGLALTLGGVDAINGRVLQNTGIV